MEQSNKFGQKSGTKTKKDRKKEEQTQSLLKKEKNRKKEEPKQSLTFFYKINKSSILVAPTNSALNFEKIELKNWKLVKWERTEKEIETERT